MLSYEIFIVISIFRTTKSILFRNEKEMFNHEIIFPSSVADP